MLVGAQLRGCSSFNSCIATILAYRPTGTKLEMIEKHYGVARIDASSSTT